MKPLAKNQVSILAALAVSACAAGAPAPVIDAQGRTGSAITPGQTRTAGPAIVVPADAVGALSRPGGADAITTRQAALMLGPPDVDRRDGAGALLTWRLPTCALVLGFANDRLISTAPAARQTGAPGPSLAQCVNEAQARRPRS